MPEPSWRQRRKVVAIAAEALRVLSPEDRETAWRLAVEGLQEHDPHCTVTGCGRPRAKGRTHCSGHQKRIVRYGDPRAHIPLREYHPQTTKRLDRLRPQAVDATVDDARRVAS